MTPDCLILTPAAPASLYKQPHMMLKALKTLPVNVEATSGWARQLVAARLHQF